MEKDVKKFLEQDNIDRSKFLANSEIINNETREIYMDDHDNFKLPILRKIVDAYKIIHEIIYDFP